MSVLVLGLAGRNGAKICLPASPLACTNRYEALKEHSLLEAI